MQENNLGPISEKGMKTFGKVRNRYVSEPWFSKMAAGGLQLSDSEEATSSVITLPRFVEKALPSHDPLKDLFGGRIIPVFQIRKSRLKPSHDCQLMY